MREELKEKRYKLKMEFKKDILFILIGILISLAAQIFIGVPESKQFFYSDEKWIVIIGILALLIWILVVRASCFHVLKMNEKHILKTENIVPNKVAKSLLELRFEEKLKEHHGNNKKELLEQGLIPKDEIDNIKDERQTTVSIKKHKDCIE